MTFWDFAQVHPVWLTVWSFAVGGLASFGPLVVVQQASAEAGNGEKKGGE